MMMIMRIMIIIIIDIIFIINKILFIIFSISVMIMRSVWNQSAGIGRKLKDPEIDFDSTEGSRRRTIYHHDHHQSGSRIKDQGSG